jgi:copper(I)-binding protein
MMIMRRLQILTIAPGATATFAPGGLHLMLESLRKPVKIGDRVPVVLTFDRTGSMRVVFDVRADAAAPAAGGMRMQDADSPPR